MRAGWNDDNRNAPTLARMVQDAGAAAVTIHGRTAEQSYNGSADWNLVARIANDLTIPVLGSGDCVYPEQILDKLRVTDTHGDVAGGVSRPISGVLVGRGVLRNPWILAQASDIVAGRPQREVTQRERRQFLLDYIALLLDERVNEAENFRHVVPGTVQTPGTTLVQGTAPARGRERWVINKLRALCAWYSKGLDDGSHLRVRVNSATSIADLCAIVDEFFFDVSRSVPA